MTDTPLTIQYSAGIIEDHRQHVLIVLPRGGQEELRRWQFPRGRVEAGESPEAALRRVARERLGLAIEIAIGQPPLAAQIDGEEVEMRYFFCGVATQYTTPDSYAETRWVLRGHLREYEFDQPSKPVADWLLDEE